MLLQPRQNNFNNMNKSNINLRPHHHNDNNGLSFQLSDFPKSYSPRLDERSKVRPHITICPHDQHAFVPSRYLLNYREELDNEVFHSPKSNTPFVSSTCSYTEEKQEVYSGKLYIIRNTVSSSPASSPARSLSRGSHTISRSSCTPHSSPTSSPSAKSSRRAAVMVRVYRYNLDHFAVISRDMLCPGKPVFVNLRHSRVMPGQSLGRFIVTAGKSDSGNIIEFETPDLSSLGHWLDAFHVYTPPVSPNRVVGGGTGIGLSSCTPPVPRSPALPTLAEAEED